MSGESFSGASRIGPIHPDSLKAQQAAQAEKLSEYAIVQDMSDEELGQMGDMAAFNPLNMARRFESLEAKRKRGKEETEEAEKKDETVFEVQRLEEVSEQFERKNPELQARTLLMIRTRITRSDTKESILKKVLDAYPDYSLADDVLDFLIETSDAEIARLVKEAKDELNNSHGREVRAGKNIATQSREFSKLGLGSPTGLRDLYRNVTGNPREATALFEELTTVFTYEKMKSVIAFLLHSLGGDLRSKGPSISRGELHRLLTEARSLQAILGVFRFFKSRMKLLEGAFARAGLSLPGRLNFEVLAKYFVKFLQERYPSSDKALILGKMLGLSEELLAQIILYTQMRDAVRQVAPKLFRSEQHRQDVLTTFIETIESLDDLLEEEEEKEKEEEEEKKDKK